MEFASGEQTTGMGLQDANGCTVKLAGIHAEYPRELLLVVGTGTSSAATAGTIDMWQPVIGTTLAWNTD